MMRLDLATADYIGARAQQQDLAAAMRLANGAMLVLADGLGGHESGADASRIVVETFREACAGGRFTNPETRRQALRETLDRANSRIAEGVNPAHGHRGMASTVVAAIISQGELSWVSVGDSHLYVWRGGRLHKLNEDHSQAGLMVRSGQYQPNDPEVQAVKSVLVSALTGRKLEIVDLPPKAFRVEPGDVLMLASDGLNTLADDEIEGIVSEVRSQGAIKLSTALLESVRNRRIERQDNTTVAIARVLEPPRPEAVEPARKPLITDPPRRVEVAPAQRSPSGQPMSLDDLSEARTERVTPLPASTDDFDEAPDPVAEAPTAADTGPRPIPTPRSGPRVPVTSEPSPAEPPHRARVSQPPRDLVQPNAAAPSPASAAPVLQPTANASEPHQAPEPSKPAVPGNGARVSLPRSPVASAKAARPSVPEEPNAEVPETTSEEPPKAKRSWSLPAPALPQSGVMRVVIVALLLLLIIAGVAIAAVTTGKPQWLSNILGISPSEIPESQRAAPPAETQPRPAAVPVPVPAVRPAQEPAQRPNAPDAVRAPTPQPVPPSGDIVPGRAAPQAEEVKAPPANAPAARPAAPASGPASAPQAPTPAANSPDAAPADTNDTAASQATPAAADPPLTEPQRPARPPTAAKQKRNQPGN